MAAQSITELVYIDSTGYHYADYPTFLAWIISQYQSIYGSDVYLEADSMDGQFLAVLAQAFYDTAVLGASVYNSFSPLTAQGVGLARVVKINGLTKNIPSYSTVTLAIVGTANTVITNGVAQDQLGQLWNLPATVTIPGGGSINVTGTAQQIGLVTALANTITTIYTPTQGWQTVNNAGAATPGAAVESDSALRQRQAASTSISAQTPFDATLAAVANVSGVSKVQGYENYTDATVNGLTAHSICVVTVGGTSTPIATAILSKKTPGTNPVGNTGPILLYDPMGMPVNIYYSAAVTAQIQCTVNLTRNANWSSDYVALIQAAVAAAINALPIGAIVYFTQLYIPAQLTGAAFGTFYITSLVIGKNGGAQSAANISLATGLNAENPVCVAGTDVTVNVT